MIVILALSTPRIDVPITGAKTGLQRPQQKCPALRLTDVTQSNGSVPANLRQFPAEIPFFHQLASSHPDAEITAAATNSRGAQIYRGSTLVSMS